MKPTLFRTLLIALIAASGIFGLGSTPDADAFVDPVTIAILAPIALKVAEKAQPYIIRGLSGGGKMLLKMGAATLKIFYLPLGILETTLGAPFGFFSSGLKHLVKGVIAPGELVVYTVLFPVALFGISVD